MEIKEKISKILINCIPIIVMLLMIGYIKDDYLLTLGYLVIITLSLIVYHEHRDLLFFILGFIIMIIAESLFLSTSVEIFFRDSLFGIMPLWLPFLWGYSFLAMKRAINILNDNPYDTSLRD